MVPERVKMSAGGERLEEVIGRKDEEELPEFEDGAFEIDGGDGSVGETTRLATQEFLNEYVPQGEISKHTMRQLIGSVRVVPADKFECHEVGEGFCFGGFEIWDFVSVLFLFLAGWFTNLGCDYFLN